MNTPNTVGETLDRYGDEISGLFEKHRELLKSVQDLCPHKTVCSYKPAAAILEGAITKAIASGKMTVFPHKEYRICPTCGKEEKICHPSSVLQDMREEADRIFSYAAFGPFQEIDKAELLRIRRLFSPIRSHKE